MAQGNAFVRRVHVECEIFIRFGDVNFLNGATRDFGEAVAHVGVNENRRIERDDFDRGFIAEARVRRQFELNLRGKLAFALLRPTQRVDYVR